MKTGEVLAGYTIERELGRGGMGVVYLASSSDGAYVALKVVHPHLVSDTMRARLAREAQTLRRVNHPGVARVLDAHLDAEVPFTVNEYVDGPTLDQYISMRGKLTGNELAHFGLKCGEAVAAIHNAGVVHRDLKPSNILVRDGDPVIIDFGVALAADASRITQTGMVMGTPGYLPPEVVNGAALSAATDWWAFAGLMVFASSGHHPFGSGSAEHVMQRLIAGTPSVEGVPSELRSILTQALSNDPEQRPMAGEMRLALEGYAKNHPPSSIIGAVGSTLPTQAQQPPRQPSATDSAETTVLGPGLGGVNPGTTHPTPQDGMAAAGPGLGTEPVASSNTPDGPASAGEGRMWVTTPKTAVMSNDTSAYKPGAIESAIESALPHGQSFWSRSVLGLHRNLLVSLGAAALIIIGTIAPVSGLVIGGCWTVLALTVTSSMRTLHKRKQEFGVSSSGDVVMVALTAPLRLITSALRAAIPLAIAVGIALLLGLLVERGLREATFWAAGQTSTLVVALSTTALMWWGGVGTDLRYGSRIIARAASPTITWGTLWAIFLTLVLAAGAMIVLDNSFSPNWEPFDANPWSVALGHLASTFKGVLP